MIMTIIDTEQSCYQHGGGGGGGAGRCGLTVYPLVFVGLGLYFVLEIGGLVCSALCFRSISKLNI